MTFWREGSLFLGLLLGAIVLAKLFTVGAFQIRKKRFDVHLDQEWIAEQRVHDHFQQVADPLLYGERRKLRAGQSRRFQ